MVNRWAIGSLASSAKAAPRSLGFMSGGWSVDRSKGVFLVKKKDRAVEALQLHGRGEYHSQRGDIMKFKDGDYMLTAHTGDQWIVSKEYLAEHYEEV